MLESVLGALSMGAVVLDNERRVVLWNAWMQRYSGLVAAEVLGIDFLSVFPDLKGKRIESAVQQALRDNFPAVLSQTLHKAPFALFASAAARLGDERMQQAVAVTPLEVVGCSAPLSDPDYRRQRRGQPRAAAASRRSSCVRRPSRTA
ncbi:PAS domain-containing protein [Massilia sp. B-10]|nr:PAS domain-containing protein [Massilia sp. B-10]